MKVLVTGAKGQLGFDVLNELISRGNEAVGVDIEEMDITDGVCVDKVITKNCPDAVIHCAAWTAVDAAEEEVNQGKAYLVNAIGTENIANICKKLDIKMMYISTDYVFNGQGEKPWNPDCKQYAPLNVYGETKMKGEIAVADVLSKFFIVRIEWAFGVNGNNFIKTMLKVGKNQESLTVVNDQIGTPTYTYDLARLLVDMIETEKYGYYHATNEGGFISWYDFACEIFRQAAASGHQEYDTTHLTVIPVNTAEYFGVKAMRPFNSRLDKSKLTTNGFEVLPTWQDAIGRYLKEIDF